MSLNFSSGAGVQTAFELIPHHTVAWVYLNLRALKIGKESGARYLDLECTIAEGHPMAGRKFFTIIMDPFDPKNEKSSKMASAFIARILECNGAGPQNPAGYHLRDFSDLSGKRAAVLIKVEKSKDPAYADKNGVAEWLTPNPEAKCEKHWARLLKSEWFTSAPQSPSAPSFQGPAPNGMSAPGAGTWGAPASPSAPAASTPPTSAPTQSLSDGVPSWLAQANQKG